MPGLVPSELAEWMADRQSDLQEALAECDSSLILELTSKMSEGAQRMVEMRGGMLPCKATTEDWRWIDGQCAVELRCLV